VLAPLPKRITCDKAIYQLSEPLRFEPFNRPVFGVIRPTTNSK
jgi:hypothetical protein